jgi:GNAT superfamily N-acetyltransferase
MVNIDYLTDMILVGISGENGEEKIIAMGGFFKTHQPSLAELALIVHKEWRGLGISQFLLQYLVQICRELNYKSFGGAILLENKAMIHIINASGYTQKLKRIEGGVTEFIFSLSK